MSGRMHAPQLLRMPIRILKTAVWFVGDQYDYSESELGGSCKFLYAVRAKPLTSSQQQFSKQLQICPQTRCLTKGAKIAVEAQSEFLCS